MKVLEIKNNLVKIAYDAKDNLALAGFVIIEDENSPYVAQVMNVKADNTTNFAVVKLLFTFNQEGILKNYNGTIPSLKSAVSLLPSNELLDIIPVETPIILGELAQQNISLKVDKTIFDNNLLVCSDNFENTTILINNFVKQINEKIVIFDTEGQFESENKIVFGKDFRLPLNYDTINFIYDNELEDVDATSKAIIQDIFIEVQEYTKTLPEGYLPFETFLSVVDQQYKETGITQLVLLKNKLLKYRDQNVFAEELKDVLNLSIEIEKNDITVIDISDIGASLQKEIMSHIYDTMNNIKSNIYAFAKISNTNSDKKLLKKFIRRENVFTTIICPHEYKYIHELKEIAQNIILFQPLTLQHDFASYNTFLNKLNKEEFIICGAHTQNIPLIVELKELEDTIVTDENNINQPESIEQPTQTDEISDNNVKTEPEISEKEEAQNIQSAEQQEEQKQEIQAQPEEEQPVVEYPDIEIMEEPTQGNNDTELISLDDNIEIVDETPEQLLIEEPEEPQTEPETGGNEIIIEENPEQDDNLNLEEPEIDYSLDEADIGANFAETPADIENNEMVEQAAKDIDRVMYEKLPQDETISFEEPDEQDELTEDDLNLIDNLAGEEDIEILEPEPLDNLTEDNNPPVIPIYPAENTKNPNNQTFEPGDKVSTPKYGEGVVEKMIKYGNKMLCSIDFPQIGRRLLDPSMTDITKLS